MLLPESSFMVEVGATQSSWVNDHLSTAPLFAWPECDNVDSSVVTLPNGESIQHNHSLSHFEGYDHQCQEYASSGNNIVAAASLAETTEQGRHCIVEETSLNVKNNGVELRKHPWLLMQEVSIAVIGDSYAEMLKGFQQEPPLEESEISMVPYMWGAHNLSDYQLGNCD
ncbi:unnamed protein product [Ilex paraguariensis]|uniref:Uncharacterized protein n=1 Tax=Ilex paraguariensis TaxID=185542 RepID=A0ABC8T2G2_9AQUA